MVKGHYRHVSNLLNYYEIVKSRHNLKMKTIILTSFKVFAELISMFIYTCANLISRHRYPYCGYIEIL